MIFTHLQCSATVSILKVATGREAMHVSKTWMLNEQTESIAGNRKAGTELQCCNMLAQLLTYILWPIYLKSNHQSPIPRILTTHEPVWLVCTKIADSRHMTHKREVFFRFLLYLTHHSLVTLQFLIIPTSYQWEHP